MMDDADWISHQKPWKSKKGGIIFFNVLKENNCQTKFYFFRNEGEIKTISDEVKLKKFIIKRLFLELLMKYILSKRKWYQIKLWNIRNEGIPKEMENMKVNVIDYSWNLLVSWSSPLWSSIQESGSLFTPVFHILLQQHLFLESSSGQ